ncbi:MAG: lactonase family protein [Verrucomicrobiales bacterium]
MTTNLHLTPCLLVAAGLASIGSLRADPRSVFFGTGGSGARGIYRASFDREAGRLGPAELAAEVGSPGFLALHPRGSVLYAVAGPGAVAYRLEADGSLTLLNSEATGDGGAAHVAVHPSGRLLLTAQYGGGSTAVFPLDDEGRLEKPTVHEHTGGSGVVKDRQEAPHPHWCGFSPDGRFALVPDLGMDGIVIYRVDPETRTLSPHGVAASVPGGGPRHMRFSPDGKHIYLLNELSLSVTVFAWNAEPGTAERLGTTPALTDEAKAAESSNSAAEILVHPSGAFVYSSNRGHDSVTVYRTRDGGRALDVIQVQPIRGALPRNIALDPSGRWLLAAGADSNTVAVHAVDPHTGRLTYQTKGIINVPAPICILFAP